MDQVFNIDTSDGEAFVTFVIAVARENSLAVPDDQLPELPFRSLPAEANLPANRKCFQVRVSTDGKIISLLFVAFNFYLCGYKFENKPWQLLKINCEQANKSILEYITAILQRKPVRKEDFVNVRIGCDYGSLEHKREDVCLGMIPLKTALNDLYRSTEKKAMKRAILVIISMFPEAMRIRKLLTIIRNNYEYSTGEPHITSDIIIIENLWGRCSDILHRFAVNGCIDLESEMYEFGSFKMSLKNMIRAFRVINSPLLDRR